MDQQLPKPADFLLHYNYGAAAVKQWGKNSSVLTKSLPIPAPLRAKHVTQAAIQKWAAVMSQGGLARNESEEAEQDRWDEDDVMLFFWGNTKVALERHAQAAQKKQEHTAYLEDWRAKVTGDPPTKG